MIAVPYASSTIGTVIDVAAAAQAAHRVGALLVVDATSAAPYELLDIERLGADVLLVSANRWGGPQVAAMAFRDPSLFGRLRAVIVILRLGRAGTYATSIVSSSLLSRIARAAGLVEPGYRLLANTGPHAHQEVPHLHVHILAGRPLGPMLMQ